MADAQIETVKQRSNIVEIIGERVNLKRAGRNFKGLCPFHGEKTPSFFVSPEMQLYKCFGCGVGGDVLAFLEAYEGMTFPEALEYLAKRAGITLVKVFRNEGDTRRERLLECLHLAAELYHFLLTKHKVGEAAREYLKQRGVNQELIRSYQLGYAPNSWHTLESYLIKKKGFKAEELLGAGLLVKATGNNLYDRFRGRIMFPQMSINGKIVGMAGRLLGTEAKEAKYINSPETEIYHKGELLFGLAQARAAVRKANRIVLVEGEFDVLASVKAFVPETAAIKGSALTKEQAILIQRLAGTVVLALDADKAGQEAILRGITVAEPLGLTLKAAEIKGGKDPDEVVKDKPQAWRDMVEKAVSVYQFYLDTAFARYDAKTGAGQKEITKMTLPVLNKIENKVEQLFYLKKLAEGLGVPVRLIEEEMAKSNVGQAAESETIKTAAEEVKVGRREKLERYVVGLGLHLDRGQREFFNDLEVNWFGEKYLAKIVEKIKALKWEEKKKPTAAEVIERMEEEIKPTLRELYSEDGNWFEMEEVELEKSAARAKRDLAEMALREEMTELAQAMAQEKERDKLSKLQTESRLIRQQLEQINST